MCCAVILFLFTSIYYIAPTVAQRHIRFSNCSEGGEAIRSLMVSPCNSDPCVVPAGSSINIYFELLSNQNSSFVRLDPRVRLLGLELPIPGIEKDACKLMAASTACPVSEGQLVHGTVPVHVYSFLPPVMAVTVWRVYGKKGLMACGTTTVTISRP